MQHPSPKKRSALTRGLNHALILALLLAVWGGPIFVQPVQGSALSESLPYTVYLPYLAFDNQESTRRVSIGPDWQLPNKDSTTPALSQDGRYVAFESEATNLLPGDTNGKTDIFVVDRQQATIALVSVSSTGVQANGNCSKPSISGDGRYVVFLSTATILVSGDANGRKDVFLRDLQTGQTTLVSVATNGTQANEDSYNPQISMDGRFIVYETSSSNLVANDSNGWTDVYLYDRQLAQTERVSVAFTAADGNDSSTLPAVSGDGRYVAFGSSASNLVQTDSNNMGDVFVRDRQMGLTFLVSSTAGGAQANGGSAYPSITADGRYVAFWSGATNLVTGDTNAELDIFVKDRQTGATERASVSSAGVQANNYSYGQIAAGGRYVVFASEATNLVPGDTNAKEDIFIRDLQTDTTARLSITSDGVQATGASSYPAISTDGALVVFQSTANNLTVGDTAIPDGVFITGADIFIRDRNSNQTSIVSRLYAPMESNGNSSNPAVSTDGRYVAFQSNSTSLVPGDSMGNYSKVFVRDMQTRQSVIASVSSSGVLSIGDSTNPSISGDGQVVSFTSASSALVAGDTNGTTDIFIRNLTAAQTVRASVSSTGAQGNDTSTQARLSRDARFVCFSSYATNLVSGDTNSQPDVFVRDLVAGSTERISVASDGSQANSSSWVCAISSNGRFVAFQSYASNLVAGDTNAKPDIFIRDRQIGQTALVSMAVGGAQSNAESYNPSISDDGRYVAFHASASNLVANDTNGCFDVFVFDRNTNGMVRVSVSSDGAQSDEASFYASISGDGQHVAFESIARNLIIGDTNKNNDIYAYNLLTGKTARVSVATKGDQGDSASGSPAISANGKVVVFQSAATNLVSGDTNAKADIFLRDRGIRY
jgi:Tol biopolymer transport system component